jgi:hypothetical protein
MGLCWQAGPGVLIKLRCETRLGSRNLQYRTVPYDGERNFDSLRVTAEYTPMVVLFFNLV